MKAESSKKEASKFQVNYLVIDGELGERAIACARKLGLTNGGLVKACVAFGLEHIKESLFDEPLKR
jgi:hypothetical protein